MAQQLEFLKMQIDEEQTQAKSNRDRNEDLVQQLRQEIDEFENKRAAFANLFDIKS